MKKIYFLSFLLILVIGLVPFFPKSSHAGDSTITICHATGSVTQPYETITINYNGLHGHENHVNDIIPAPVGGCPGGPLPG